MSNLNKYYINTYGCQMNVHESEKIAGILQNLGYTQANNEQEANIIVFNTCCIRQNAEDRLEGNVGALKKLKKQNNELIIAVGGCMTQQKGTAEQLKRKFPFIDIIFGTHNLEDFERLLLKKKSQKKKVVEVLEKEQAIKEGTPKFRTSYPNAWVNITYGCNNFCTYCIVPYVRGRERSRKSEDIINECKQLIAEGYKEITLLGQNVNAYGNDLEGESFANLIEKISALEGDFWLRFMTNHPKDFTEDLVKAVAKSEKACKSIHLPVQAGSNRILKLMNRRYTREDYFSKIEMLKKYIPDACITSDIMVGFPTETEQDFLDTLDLVEKVQFSSAFTFIYSRRDGTPASVMDGQIDEEVSKDRITRLIKAQNEISQRQSEKYLNTTIKVLCEDYDQKRDKFMGRDTYGRMAYFSTKKCCDLVGKFVNVKITKVNGVSLFGEIQD